MGEVKVVDADKAAPNAIDTEGVSSSGVVLEGVPSQADGLPLDAVRYAAAVSHALDAVANGCSKAAAARTLFERLSGEPREVVLRAFIEGATVTPKGAPTYYYNITRHLRRVGQRGVKPSAKVLAKSAGTP